MSSMLSVCENIFEYITNTCGDVQRRSVAVMAETAQRAPGKLRELTGLTMSNTRERPLRCDPMEIVDDVGVPARGKVKPRR